jgi:hypothetical protein
MRSGNGHSGARAGSFNSVDLLRYAMRSSAAVRQRLQTFSARVRARPKSWLGADR